MSSVLGGGDITRERGTGKGEQGKGERGKGYQSSEALPHRQIPTITSSHKYKVHTSHSSSPFGIVLRSTEIKYVCPPYVDCESYVVAGACCDVRDADGCVDNTPFERQTTRADPNLSLNLVRRRVAKTFLFHPPTRKEGSS